MDRFAALFTALALALVASACADGAETPASPQSLETAERECEPAGATEISNSWLGVTLCLPEGWAPSDRLIDGMPQVAPASTLEEQREMIFFSPEYFAPGTDGPEIAGIRVRIDYAPPGASFEGCAPGAPTSLLAGAVFCEDVYFLPGERATFTPSGDRTGWKLSLPALASAGIVQERPGGQLYIKVVFASADRATAESRIRSLLESVRLAP